MREWEFKERGGVIGSKDKLIIQKINEERKQAHSTRQNLYKLLEKEIGVPVISFFTSFVYPVGIENSDVGMLQEALRKSDLSKGFALFLSSPGGDALAAERIINVCRAYSGTKKYQVIVAGMAKSAATLICLGASEIIMSETSELGPVDPQIVIKEGNSVKRFSIYKLVESYKELFEAAVTTQGRVEPYLQQLANYDEREITHFQSILELTKDITIKVLKDGMLKDDEEDKIEEKIKIFLTPERAKIHERPIYAREVKSCGLKVRVEDLRSKFWSTVCELYVRLNNYVSHNDIAKCIESKDYSFIAKI